MNELDITGPFMDDIGATMGLPPGRSDSPPGVGTSLAAITRQPSLGPG
jgi:hypothetical protein